MRNYKVRWRLHAYAIIILVIIIIIVIIIVTIVVIIVIIITIIVVVAVTVASAQVAMGARARKHKREAAWASMPQRRLPAARSRSPIDSGHVRQGVVVSSRALPTQEGKPRWRLTTVLYIDGSAPRVVDHRGPADEDAALPQRTRVSFTMCERTRWVWDWQRREWTSRAETVASRIWSAEQVN